MEQATHRLGALLHAAAFGEFPPADGTVEVLPPLPGPAMAVLGFTRRYVIASSAHEVWVREQLPAGDLLAPMSPRFLVALGDTIGRRDDGVDVLLAAPGLEGRAQLEEVGREAHPRVARAQAYREDVRVFADLSGAALLIMGRGLGLRTEVAIEVRDDARDRGLAREVLMQARRLVSPDEALFAQRPRATPRRCAPSSLQASVRSAARCCSSARSRRQRRCEGTATPPRKQKRRAATEAATRRDLQEVCVADQTG